MNSETVNNVIENLVWSKVEYKLKDFVGKFVLPQIVRVEEGYYGPTEDSCLGSEQILTLHAVRSSEKIRAKDHRNRDIHIPVNCSQRVEIRPQNLKDVYESVSELSSVFPKFVRVVQGYYNLENEDQCVSPGDKLELKRITRGDIEDVLEFENQERVQVRLPMSVKAGFQPLVDGREYYLKELINSMKTPVLFQFVDSQVDMRGASNVFSSTLGVLKLLEVYRDETIICTTKESNMRYVVTVPKSLEVTVTVAEGALIGDKDYVRICHSLHDGVSLTKVDNLELENLYASRKQIRGYRNLQVGLSSPPLPPPREDQESLTTRDETTNHIVTVADKIPSDTAQYSLQTKTNGSESSPSSDRKISQPKQHNASYHDHLYEHIPGEELESLKLKTGSKNADEKVPLFGPSLDEIADQQHLNCKKSITTGCLESQSHSEYVTLDQKSNGRSKLFDKPDMMSLQGSKSVPPGSSETRKNKVGFQMTGKTYRPPIKPKPIAPSIPPRPDTGTTATNLSDAGEMFSDLFSLTVKEVSEFLQKYHFDDFVQLFYDNDIDGEMLMSMDDEMLKSLGMNAFQSKKLLKLIGGWRPKT